MYKVNLALFGNCLVNIKPIPILFIPTTYAMFSMALPVISDVQASERMTGQTEKCRCHHPS
ncbi:MAG: hypothetical protein KAT76_01515 [Bacteroidales bacterium]|nr:hypothetical protein [Bacteroidales bacterium]